VITAGEIKVTNADRKKSSARGTRRGQFGSDFTEDEEWAEQVGEQMLACWQLWNKNELVA
jgi:hypothetical protein